MMATRTDPSWELAVLDPATALECLQSNLGPSLVDAAVYFHAAEKAFNTYITHSETLQESACTRS
jgi:hypothetical protein